MDLYEILGVGKDASIDDIKRAYRQKSKETHSDLGGSDEQFKRVNVAYQILSNPEKRTRYDSGEDAEQILKGGEEEVHQILRDLFLQIVTESNVSVEQFDIHKAIVLHIRETQNTLRINIKKLQSQVDKLTKASSRMTAKGGDNLFARAARVQISILESKMGSAKHALSVGDRALKILENYDYKTDPGDMTTAYTRVRNYTISVGGP
jgi:curved DNA-binding protein CbpA